MPFLNFKIVNAKKLKDGILKTIKNLHIYSLRFQSLAGTQRYKRGFMRKTRKIKLKIQEKHMTLSSLLMFLPEFNLERKLCKTSVLSFHPLIKTKFNYLQAG